MSKYAYFMERVGSQQVSSQDVTKLRSLVEKLEEQRDEVIGVFTRADGVGVRDAMILNRNRELDEVVRGDA